MWVAYWAGSRDRGSTCSATKLKLVVCYVFYGKHSNAVAQWSAQKRANGGRGTDGSGDGTSIWVYWDWLGGGQDRRSGEPLRANKRLGRCPPIAALQTSNGELRENARESVKRIRTSGNCLEHKWVRNDI